MPEIKTSSNYDLFNLDIYARNRFVIKCYICNLSESNKLPKFIKYI